MKRSSNGAEPAEFFWSRPDLVDAYSVGEALPYESDVIRTAVDHASRSGEVSSITVLGVGAGRELGAVRRLAPDASIHAWDISGPMVQRCSETIAARGWSDVTVERGSISDIPAIHDGSADVVVALGAVLGYCVTSATRARQFERSAALLRPGGTLAAMVQQRHGRPDWAAYFSLLAAAELFQGRPATGNRLSRHGDAAVWFHHFSRRELRDLCRRVGLTDCDVYSLREWARSNGGGVPHSSPNPLMLVARAGA